MTRQTQFPALILLFLLALLYYLPGILSPRDFTVADEARYAEVLREMTDAGHWAVPQLNAECYSDKPPLYFWTAAAVSRLLGGITPLGFLLVTWLGAAGSAWVVYSLGAEIFSRRTGWIGALLLMSSFVFLICAQIVRMDMPMAFFIALAFLFFYRGVARSQPAQFYGFYIAAAVAVLLKGPFGFLIPFASALGFLLHGKRWRMLRAFVLHGGFPVFLAMVGGWLAFAWFSGEQAFVRDIFGRQMAGRALHSSIQRQPFFFYALVLPLVALPWSPFLWRAWRSRPRQDGDGPGILMWWFAGGFVIMSAVSGKLFIYVLPLMPPVVLLVAAFLDRLWEAPRQRSGAFRAEGLVASLLTFGLLSLLPLAASRIPAAAGLRLWPLTAVCLPVAALGIAFSWSGRVRALVITLAAGMWLFSACVFQLVIPQVNDIASARLIGQDIAGRLRKGEAVATFRVQRGILNFYANAILPDLTPEQLPTFLETPRHAVVMVEKELKRQPALQQQVDVLATYYIVDRRYMVVARRSGQ